MTERTSTDMDQAAGQAEATLGKLRDEYPEAVALMAGWWKDHYLATGHKRLARLLLRHAGKGGK